MGMAYVGDVVGALVKLMVTPSAIGEVFNVGNTEEVTIRGLAERIKIRLQDYRDVVGRFDRKASLPKSCTDTPGPFTPWMTPAPADPSTSHSAATSSYCAMRLGTGRPAASTTSPNC